MTKTTVYACGRCGATVKAPVMAALGVPQFRGQCPGCGKWADFADAKAKPVSGKKAA